jgi:peptidoglycan/xylan/chitin deacetylase (PgdA/CDA1 family)
MSLNLWERARGRYIRSAAGSFFRRPLVVRTKRPLISFSFDDFPRSAFFAGGTILQNAGVRGTYYVSLGLMGKQEPTGTICLPEDLKLLRERGHELGCHTFDHCDSWNTETSTFLKSVNRNRQALVDLFPGSQFKSFSYPINPPRIRTKGKMAKQFVCSRGGGQRHNVGTTDSNYLAAYFLEKSRGNLALVKEAIDLNHQSGGWLIFATHDIDSNPTPYGCTPEFFSEVVEYSLRSGALVVPVIEAFEMLKGN